MIARTFLIGLALLVAVGAPARADALSSGLAAFHRADYLAAARRLGPLATRRPLCATAIRYSPLAIRYLRRFPA